MRKIRMGMVGGGEGAFIGAVHRMAANLDGKIELVCGAFSGNAERSRKSGRALYLPNSRIYGSYEEMFNQEAALPAGDRMDFVAIVTPNHLHFPIAKAAMQTGFHVLSDKPATINLTQALDLREIIQETGMLYALTHTYTGYPMVKEARQRILAGELGRIRKILVEYPQGWLSVSQENDDNKQASWRLDPERAGISCCMGDIGTHAANLVEYVSDLSITEICADLTAFVPNRTVDDDGSVLLRLSNGAKGVLTASQVCVGEENALHLRIYGEQGGLEWAQQEPNTLLLKSQDEPTRMLRTSGGYLSDVALANARTPGGHPEGYLEAFGNIYRNFAGHIEAVLTDREPTDIELDYPGIREGIEGMAFIETVVASSDSEQKWLALPRY